MWRIANKKMLLLGLIILVVIVVIFFLTRSVAIQEVFSKKLTQAQVAEIIAESDSDNPFHVAATPEVVAKLNKIRGNKQERELMLSMLRQMVIYKPIIQSELQKNDMPEDLLVIPMIESKYLTNSSSSGPGSPTGLWQITRTTAGTLNLNISGKNDERKNVQLASVAALGYFRTLNDIFHDWGLTLLAYNAGDAKVLDLIKITGSRDVWVLARAPSAPAQSLHYLTMFDTYVIIMRNPTLVGGT
ncbi:MAG: transglycosylase SLT domain-containing protein [Gammaproteobacteria bacterium]